MIRHTLEILKGIYTEDEKDNLRRFVQFGIRNVKKTE